MTAGDEASYTEGYWMIAPLGRGMSLLGVKTTGHASETRVISTGFTRCIPAAVAATEAQLTGVTESAGTITITGTSGASVVNVLALGVLY